MENCETKKHCCSKVAKPLALLGASFVLSFAFVSLGEKVYDGLTHFRSFDRYITVKGLATKDVDADLAVWSLSFNMASETLADAQANLAGAEKTVRDFLVANGLKPEQIRLQNMNVVDRKAQIYNNGGDMTLRYILSETLVARTGDVAAMVKASQNVSELVKSGVTLGDPNGGTNPVPQYLFTKLNDIKPELIAEATKNAREAAEQFARDSGARVGSIRRASQGLFTIDDRDKGSPDHKKVRVVTTVEYFL